MLSELIKKVGELYNKQPKAVEEILNNIEKVTKRVVVSIAQENVVLFKQSLKENEELLEKLTVVSMQTKELLFQLSKFGEGKVTGAGGYKTGSGNILFFAENAIELKTFLKESKISYMKFRQDFTGVKKES